MANRLQEQPSALPTFGRTHTLLPGPPRDKKFGRRPSFSTFTEHGNADPKMRISTASSRRDTSVCNLVTGNVREVPVDALVVSFVRTSMELSLAHAQFLDQPVEIAGWRGKEDSTTFRNSKQIS